MSARGRHGDQQAARKRALLARLLNERGMDAPTADTIGRRSDAEAFPISFAQQRLWFLDQLEPESPRYNVFTVLGLHGALDAAALEHTLTEILRRHETLRVRFVQAGGRPRQLIAPPGPFPLASLDLSGLPQTERREELRRLALAEAQRPFDLSRGPLVRGTLVRLDREENALLLGMHHIASDGWSMGVLTGELAALYAAFREGRPSPLPELPIQYADFAAWQHEWLSGEVMESELAYWRRRLGGLETVELPTDRPRPAVQSFAGAIQSVALRAGLLEGLRKLGQRHEATLFMTFLAALQALLHRYSGQVDIAVGAPIAGRGRAEIESLIGFFANTLVLRTSLAGDPSFRVLLGRVRDVALGAYAHSELPFEKLVEELHPERDLSRNPLFQVALVLQNAPEAPLELPGLRVELGGVDSRVAKFDLTLYVSETGPGHLSFEYNTDLFQDATVARALGHLENLLAAAAADPERRISELPLLSEREQRRLLLEWNATASEYPSGRTVLDLFAEHAAATPEALAVESGGESLSYGELDRRSNRLARRLRDLGVGPEVLVGVSLRRSPDLVVGLLGILKAGGAYLPLDPEYPKQRLHLMLEDASVPVLVSEQALLGALPGHGAQVVCLDRDAEALASQPDAPLESGVSPENLAYVIYTSGSTGRPKGVQVQHGGLVNLASWHVREYGVGPEDRATLIASIAFDASAWEVWPYLIAGASLHVPDEETRLLPRRLCAWLTKRAITHSFIMTPLAESLLAERGLDRLGLRYLLTGGDKLHRQAVQELPCAVVNHYGPTEYTVVTTAGEVDAGASSDPPIGRPISNTRVYVLGPGLRPVTQGVAGELYIGGAGLARGYLKRPDLTAERFVPDPFSAEPGGRLYRAGDLVRYRSDGSLDFLGRADHQVKLRGYRIEPGEIESRLESHPQIEQAAVLAREDEPGEKRLVAYVVKRAGSSVTVGELRDRLAEALPGYMVPSAFVFLESMPLSPNGKVDHRALPAPEATDRETDYESPRTKAEAILSQIWSDVLRVERVGIRDNFFELGGDSILSIQIVARANEAGLRLTPKQVFQHQTVAGLAGVAGTAAAVEAEQGRVLGEAPLTPIQRWFFERELEEAHHFNQAVLLELGRELPAELLERAAVELQRHHDALRLRFHRVGSGWVQDFSGEECASPFTRVALGEVEERELPSAVTRAAERAQATLDLASGPVWRMVLIEPGGGRAARLLLAAHHLVVDGVSWRVLLEDLERACGQLLRGERVSLPRKTSSYRSWSERLRDHVSAGGFAEERGHWIRTVEAGTEALPRDFDGEEGSPADTAGTSRSVSVVLDEEATRTLLREVPAAYRTRIDEVLLTALCLAMREWTGRGSVLLDVESHGREELFEGLDLSRTVGWFTAIHPVRLELPDGGSPGEALKAVKERLRRIPHRGVGYGALLYLGEDRALRGAARPQLSFNYLGQFDQVLSGQEGLFRPARESAGRMASPRSRRSHLLEVNGSIAGGRLRMDFSYGESAHRPGTVEALARGFETGLRRVIAHCRSEEAGGRTPSDFPLARLDQATLDLVLAGARDVEDVYPLSPMQQGLLFHTLLDPGVGVYVEQLRLDLQGEMNAAAWRRAWEHVVERHPILRTRFAWKGLREPCQIVLPGVALPWEEEDWTGLGEGERQERLETLLEEDHRAGFDLERAPLLRHRLIRTGEDEHSFAWSFHHILFDGWCLPLLLNEVFRCYAAYREGRQPDLEPAPRFRDYVEWLEKMDRGQAEAYWRSALRGFSEATPLPWDHRDVDEGEARYGEQTFELSREATARLRDLGRRHRLTLNTFVLGAWALLLSRYANEPDVVFGSTVSGRPADVPRVESMVGLFVNTLPLRTQAEGGERLLPWLGRIQAQQVEMREHDFVPLVDIRSWTDVPAGHSLFDTILGFQNYPLEPAYADLGPMRIRGGRIRERTHFALTLMVQPGAGLGFRVLNDRRRVRGADVTRMFGHLRTLLEGMAADPERRLRELPSVTGGERDQVLVEWNATGREREGESSVTEAFERAAERAPGAEAVVGGETRLTYGELDRRSNQLARHLVRFGVGPEVPVGICMERSPELVLGALGVLKAGGAYLPMDPAYPQAQLGFMLGDSGATVLLTQERLLERLPPHGAAQLCLDRDWDVIARESEARVPRVSFPENLAYVIYTSGSTGRPKGVEVPHRGLTNLVGWHRRVYEVSATDRATQLAGPAFDASVWEVWPYLTAGAALHIPDEETRLSSEKLGSWLAGEGITLSFLPTPLAEMLLKGDGLGELGLRVLLTGGDKLHALPGGPLPFRLVNHYGPTESSVVATCTEVEAGEGSDPPIGRPIDNTRTYVLDAHLNPAPVGVAGELYIGGEGLARGYLGAPGLTAERFVPDPFGAEPGGRLYRTGDLARYRPDGNLEFLGRIDHQVKLRGFRVELGEIESVLGQHPEVKGAVVVARPEGESGQRLVAYVVHDPRVRGSGELREQAEWQDQHVAHWQALYEETYGQASASPDPAFDITGWNSSYTGQPIPEREMREWVERTAERILSLRPKRVLEIGCGTGLLLSRIAPQCEGYLATDFSEVALRHVRERILAGREWGVELRSRMADDFSGIEPGGFDGVVLNSVVQYFPGVEYLLRVLEGAVRAVRPGGFVFVGDVRNLGLLETYHASVQLHQAPLSLAVAQLRQRVRDHVSREEELVLDPEFFAAFRTRLAGIREVQVQPRRGAFKNELNRFRYDAVLRVGREAAGVEVPWVEWDQERPGVEAIRRRLLETEPECLGFARVVNGRVARDVAAAQLLLRGDGEGSVEELREAVERSGSDAGVDPEELWALERELPYRVELSWLRSGEEGRYDVAFCRRGTATAESPVRFPGEEPRPRPWGHYASDPLRARSAEQLVPRLRRFLEEQLPDHMVPAAFVLLESLPLTPNGKVDRKALPAPGGARPELDGVYVAPRSPVEEALAGIWRDVLGLEQLGVHDDFFELGGHSLLATQVVSRLREVLKVDLPLRDLFEARTVARLAELVAASRQRDRRPAPPLQRVPRERELPLSFAQQRLWLLDQLQPGGTAYNMYRALRLDGPLELPVLQRSLEEIVRRHESLRTTFFVDSEGIPRQRIAEPFPPRVPVADLGSHPEGEREREALRRATEEALRPYSLADGPLFRTLLLRLSGEQHLLVLGLHHIVCDGWSLELLDRELGILYAAFLEGRPSPLPEISVQYADFAAWQRDWLSGEVLAGQLAYWRDRLGSLPSSLDLPYDRPRPSVQTQRGATEALVLPVSLASALRTVSRARGATLFMTLLAAFKALLSRCCGQHDIVVGTPIANRGRTEAERIIGFFVNTLVLRSDLSGDPRFSELLERVKDTALGAYDNQDLPFERLVEELHPARDLSRTPLFQVFFNMVSAVPEPPALPGLTVRLVGLEADTAKFDLTLYAAETADGLVAAFNYNVDLFEAATIRTMMGHFRALLEKIAADPGRRLSTLPPLATSAGPESRLGAVLEQLSAEPERKLQALSRLASASTPELPDPRESLPEPDYEPVTALFEEWVERSPRSVALRRGELSLSYGELAERARGLARRLVAEGLARNEVVALDADSGFGLIVALLGVWLAGGVVLPLDRRLPAERRKLLCREAGAKRLVRTSAPQGPGEDWISAVALPTVALDATGRITGSPRRGEVGAAVPMRLAGRDAAYIFFTSGTTGKPKGVLGTHGGLGHFVSWQRQTFGVGPGDRSSQLTSPSFDVVLREIFLPLTSGATLCFPEDPTELGADRVLPWLDRERVTILHTVPTIAQTWLSDHPESVSLQSLRCMFFAGEPLPASFVRRWRKAFPGNTTIVNLYGPTETTLAKCFHVVPSDPGEGIVPVGRPLPETQALVLASDGRLCGVGDWGEIVIRTPYRTRGYVNAPEENRRRFARNPFRDEESDLLYLTGDQGRYRADGVLEIGGRLDDQVKVRGVRVEPGEVEAALAEHPAVRHCAVVAREGASGEKHLVAFVVPREGDGPSFEALRTFLARTQPESHIPSAFAFLDALPVTPNGKLDRRALPLDRIDVSQREALVAPRSPIEQELAAIWREILGVGGLGVHDDFFRLGGHSLLATQVMSRVRAAFRTELPLRVFFESPTIASLAAAVAAALRQGPSATAAPIRPASAADRRALSFAQERLWFIEQLDPGKSPYRFSTGLRLSGRLDVAALRGALDEIVARHETLRTRFAQADGRVEPIVSEAGGADFSLTDLSHEPEALRDERTSELAREEADKGFDLARGQVFRTRLLRLGPEDHVLLISMHHVVSDIWSGAVLVRELSALYSAFRESRPSPLAPLPIQYADYARWQRELLSGEVLEQQVGYWRRQLEGVRALQLRTDRPRPAELTFSGGREMRVLPPELARELRELGRREGATLFMVLLAGFQALLARYTGEDDVAVGTPIANRHRAETEGLIGFFVNSLVMRTRLAGDPSFPELLRRVKQVALEAYDHQDLPFEKLVEELRPERNRGRNPLFQVMFALQNAPFAPLDLPGLTLSPLDIETRRTHFEIELFAWEATSGLVLALGYNTDLFEAETARRLLRHYERLLTGWVSEPERRISELPLLSGSEERRLLLEWNATGEAYPSLRTIVDLFAEQAARTPEAAAVVSDGESLSYAELDRRSNRLARHLRALGVGPEVLVGVCLERSKELVVGVLGILKAGGAYLPLDPEYPKQRLGLMLEDASVPVLLSEQSLLGVLPEHGAQVVCLDRDAEALLVHSDAPLESGVEPENLAYVIYTSGSTGRPKGVQVRHGGLVNLASWHVRAYGVAPGDRATLIASVAFDASTWELWPYLIAGASLHVPDEETRLLPRRLATWLVERAITHCFIMTPLAESLLSEAGREGLRLRYLLTGGDKLHRSAVQELPCPVVNHYGPTEYSVVTTAGEVSAGSTTDPAIGRPIANTRVYVLDARLRPVPQGVAGELFIAGAGLARGYLKRPDLTAERFVPDPFSTEPGCRLYRTGDLVRYRADGSLDFLGRLDHQVKLRGYRIELGEIEAALAALPELEDGVVVLRDDRPGDEALVAYVVPRSGSRPAPSAAEIREKLRQQLPHFMVPGIVVPIETLPLTASGKIDRRALPSPDASRRDDDALVPPRDDTEERLARIWGEVLGLPQVGIHQNFFDLGGHSMLLTKVHARVREAFPETELALVELFEHATVASLAERLRGAPSFPAPVRDAAERLQGRERLRRRLELRRRDVEETSG